MTQDECPICSETTNQVVLLYNEFPYFTVPLEKSVREVVLKKYHTQQLVFPLDVRACSRCSHCYLHKIPDQEIIDFLYANCYSYPSPLKGGFQPERDNHFLQSFLKTFLPICKARHLESVLEIGCFDGYVLYHLQQYGFTVIGCDPSEGAEIGKAHGLNILRRFFNAEEFLEKQLTFDVIISRHLIEHVIHPRAWIASLSRILNPGGILILETPNVQFYLEKGLLEAFSLQHLQGFSSISLESALNREGMDVVNMKKTHNLITLADKKKSGVIKGKANTWGRTISNFNKKLKKNKNNLYKIIFPFIEENKNIGLWGAGGFGFAALSLYQISPQYIDFIIDSDSNKWNMTYLSYSLPLHFE